MYFEKNKMNDTFSPYNDTLFCIMFLKFSEKTTKNVYSNSLFLYDDNYMNIFLEIHKLMLRELPVLL